MKKILILGANGMAGHVINLVLRDMPDKFIVTSIAKKHSKVPIDTLLDVTNFMKLSELIHISKFDFIINCTGILNKKADSDFDQAILINSYLPHFLEKITQNTSTKVIHLSTDCVFSGKSGDYKEGDFKDGIGVYALSKSLGEIENNKDLTIRTSIIGPELHESGIGLFNWFMKQSGSSIYGFTKAFWSGVTTLELARILVDLMDIGELSGIVHVTSAKKINKYDLITLFKQYFKNKDFIILEDRKHAVDKSLLNTRKDFKIEINSYDKMISDLKIWINQHSSLYRY
ncbi:dTDP-4-dehydrorhamnose reductase family protein [Aquirufa ecclesiirivi]|uniref:dTDP-4-dehydrorhamnose reductase family protein n=1 Tax=Aquirufa ecclesiirivi TaxID=2715124 RepID=UPI00140B79FF|nr:SDR family oxidoreductase [Aquirufa ecclesiirivi]NHC48162.1 SDR family oxidoreductase [Aquirufa ecclesiirivi]